MRKFVLFVLVLSAAPTDFADSSATNATVGAAAVVATTNAPAAMLPRQQCEAVTKSGNRCKRNAVPGARLCRQHQKIAKQSKIKQD